MPNQESFAPAATAVGPWTVTVWLATPGDPHHMMLAQGYVHTLPDAARYTTDTWLATCPGPDQWVWVEAASADRTLIATYSDTLSPWLSPEGGPRCG